MNSASIGPLICLGQEPCARRAYVVTFARARTASPGDVENVFGVSVGDRLIYASTVYNSSKCRRH